jgi:hypothetical protein
LSEAGDTGAEPLPPARTRAAVALVSAAAIALELTLMRALSFRFWHHFAYMVISVALIGFGASGTALTILSRRVRRNRQAWLYGAILLFAVAAAVLPRAIGAVPVNVQSLAWDPPQALAAGALEALAVVPFFFAAFAVGTALTDRRDRIAGHYAANLVGSGAGAILALAAMWWLETPGLFASVALAGCAAAVFVLPRRRVRAVIAGTAAVAVVVAASLLAPAQPAASEYKMISYLANMPGTRTLFRAEGPLGRVDAIEGPSVHYAPGLSLHYAGPIPGHFLLLSDGEVLSAVYDAESSDDYRFMDFTTAALPYHLRSGGNVCIIGAGGGADIGLALYNKSDSVDALEMNPVVIRAMSGPLAERAGDVYTANGVNVINAEGRGYLSHCARTYDVIQVPVFGSFGGTSAGVHSANENYLYTVESFSLMLDRLGEEGVVSVTGWAQHPPRAGPRVLDTLAQALRGKGLDPGERIAMIRSWATVTTIASKKALSGEEKEALRAFCDERGFDLCWLAGLRRNETNRFHVLERPVYFEAAEALLGEGREAFLAEYPFEIEAATDDRPYFSHFFTLRSLEFLEEHFGRLARAYVEIGYLLLLAALIQTVAIGAALTCAPLVLRVRSLLAARGKTVSLGYFALLGIGFMLVEMFFLQKLILYLAHPIYSGAAVISGFLLFAGAGSLAAPAWRANAERVARTAAAAVVVMLVGQLFVLDPWLSLTAGAPTALRFAMAVVTVAPLAFAMGHMFPLGLARVAGAGGALVPFAWAVNGFTSVVATVAAPGAALHMGFSRLAIAAGLCYVLAGLLFARLPRPGST